MTTESDSTLYDALAAAGCEIDNHYSDLYVKATPSALEIVRKHKASYSGFTHQVTGERWLDIPFGFAPFWEKVSAKARGNRA